MAAGKMNKPWADITDEDLEEEEEEVEAEEPTANANAIRYLNEDLPEIEVREVVSVEEMRRDMPNFIAFTDRQIEGKVRSLFTTEGSILERKTEAMVKLHKAVIATMAASPDDADYGIYYHVPDIDRGDFSDTTEVMRQYENIDKSRSYISKQAALDEFYRSLVSKSDVDGNRPTTRTRELILDFAPIDMAVIEVGDPLTLPIEEKVTLAVPTLEASFLAERVEARNRFEEVAPPTFANIIANLKELPDTHFLDALMAKHNVDATKAKLLGKALLRLDEKESGRPESVPRAHALGSCPKTRIGLDPTGHMRLVQLLATITPVTSTTLTVEDVTALAQAQAAALPAGSQTFGYGHEGLPKTNHELIASLVDGRQTPEALAETILSLRRMENTQRDIAFVRSMTGFNVEKFNAKLARQLAAWALVHISLRDDIGQILDIYKEVAEIKIGNDSTRYDGDIPTGEQYDNKEAGEVFRPMPTAPGALPDAPPTKFNIKKLFPNGDGDEVPPGKEEVVLPLAAMLEQLRSISGLPLDLPQVLQRSTESVNILSRRTILKQAFPEVDDAVIQEILDSEVDYDNFILPNGFPDLAKTTKAAYHKEVRASLLRSLAIWAADLQIDAMGGGLELDIGAAAQTCLSAWSPYGGAPLNDAKMGILPYLAAVAFMIVKNEYIGIWPAFFRGLESPASLQKDVAEMMREDPALMRPLEAAWEQFKKDRKEALVDKAKMAEMSLIEAINNKDRARFLPNYLKTLILLPRVLASREKDKDRDPLTVPGCCLQRLYPGFRANEDLQKYVFTQRMERLREVFAKKRVGIQERPALQYFARKPRPSAAEATAAPAPALVKQTPLGVETAPDLDQLEWLRDLAIPPAHITRIRNDVKEATALAEQMFDSFQKTARSKSPDIQTFIFGENTSTDDLATVISIIPGIINDLTKRPEDIDMINAGIDKAISIRQATQLGGTISKIGERYFHRVFQYLLTTALLLPTPIAGTTAKGAYEKALAMTLKAVEARVRAMRVPTEADIQDTLNKLREADKVKAIAMQDVMQDDDRSTFNMLKNLLAKTAETREYMEGREKLGREEQEPLEQEQQQQQQEDGGGQDPFEEGVDDWGTDEGFGYGIEKEGENPDQDDENLD